MQGKNVLKLIDKRRINAWEIAGDVNICAKHGKYKFHLCFVYALFNFAWVINFDTNFKLFQTIYSFWLFSSSFQLITNENETKKNKKIHIKRSERDSIAQKYLKHKFLFLLLNCTINKSKYDISKIYHHEITKKNSVQFHPARKSFTPWLQYSYFARFHKTRNCFSNQLNHQYKIVQR